MTTPLSKPDAEYDGSAIAIIGMSGRFPGAEDISTFWRHIQNGVELVSQLTDDDVAAAGLPASITEKADYVRARGVLKDADCFDYSFFGYSPREAMVMDPQHRILLEAARGALENAGYAEGHPDGWTGVFAGAARASYWLNNLQGNPSVVDGDDQTFIGNEKDFLATRVAFKLDLHGPAVDLQTGCSTSLVAVHAACRALQTFECDMALAGGVTVALPLTGGYTHHEESVLAKDGHCRPFDASGDGIVPGNAVALVVLKRMADAIADGDCIQAVIRATAVNNDGRRKMSFTAPSVDGQSEVILLAQQLAGLTGDEIGLVEAHGTGTRLGDPIEVSALTQAFRETTANINFCALGSVKGNSGHLDAAAGVAGLIKAVCAVRDGVVPPTINLDAPNPAIDFAATPFYLPRQAKPWVAAVRRAGVSAFGIGGTNAHVIVESPPTPAPSEDDGRWRILPLSAHTESSLNRIALATAATLAHGDVTVRNAAFTLQNGRSTFSYRAVAIARNGEEAAAALRGQQPLLFLQGVAPASKPRVAFLFPGGGGEYHGAASKQLMGEAAFREAIHEMAGHFRKYDIDVLSFLCGAELAQDDTEAELPSITLPATFTFSYAMARLWQARRVTPDICLGHSLGEYVAATIADCFSPADAAKIVALRSRLQEAVAPGAMLSAMASPDVVFALGGPGIDLAAVNGPDLCTVSGSEAAIDELSAALAASGHTARKLAIRTGAHSRAIRQSASAFRESLNEISMQEPKLALVSSLHGRPVEQELTTPDYWVDQLCETVRFDRALDTLLGEPDLVLLECGRGGTLNSLAAQHPKIEDSHVRVTSLRPSSELDDEASIRIAAARLWVSGVDVSLEAQPHQPDGVRCPLPTYSFDRHRLWIDPPANEQRFKVTAAEKPIDDWFHLPIWRRTPPLVPVASSGQANISGTALLFADGSSLSDAIIDRLRQNGWPRVVVARPGSVFGAESEDSFTVRPGSREDIALMLTAAGTAPTTVFHLWCSGTGDSESLAAAASVSSGAPAEGFETLIALFQALSMTDLPLPSNVIAGVYGTAIVGPTDAAIPCRAALLGALQVIPQEFSGVICRSVDIDPAIDTQQLALLIIAEADAMTSDDRNARRLTREPTIALRANMRFVRNYQPVQITKEAPSCRPVSRDDVIVITGGLGRIGLLLAEHLAKKMSARVALIGRPSIQIQAGGTANSATAQRMAAVAALVAAGCSIKVYAADVTDQSALSEAFDTIERDFGPISGVVHAAAVTHGSTLISPIADLTTNEAEAQFAPKILGAEALEMAVLSRANAPKFVLLLSSNASVLGGIGFAAYSAANFVLDHFAADRNRTGETAWISSNWDRWLTSADELKAGQRTSMDLFAMKPSESLEACERIITKAQVEQLVVTRGDLPSRLRTWISAVATETEPATRRIRRHAHTPYHPPETATQEAICALWSEMLGIEQISIDDNFFELGGHSLRAIQILTRVADMFAVRVTLKSFFTNATVAGLSNAVVDGLNQEINHDEAATLLAGLENIAGLAIDAGTQP